MHPSASGYTRDLVELHRLAGELFDALRDEYRTENGISVWFDRIDGLVEITIEEGHLVATTLLCAQLLHRVTVEPQRAEPRHVVTLGDIIDQALATLLHDRRPDSVARVRLRDLHQRVCTICMNLALIADPGAGSFERPG